MTGQEIAAIASSGVMGLATLFLLLLLSKERRAPGAHIFAAVAVIVLGAVVQLTTLYFEKIASFQAQVRVELTPTATQFPLYLPPEIGAPMKARPRVWLSNTNVKCRQVAADDCPDFSKKLILASGGDTIYVSVDEAMQEMRDRILRLTATTRALSPPIDEAND
jgi:hypothetical protein